MIIKCKGVFLNKMVIITMISGGLISLGLYLLFPGVKGYLYFMSMVLLFCSIIYIFYLNRFELLMLGVEQNELHLSFINNSFFKRHEIKVDQAQVRVKQDGDKLTFFIDGQQQAIIRKSAISEIDWNKLLDQFNI
ncbi:hypothetical protein FHW36_113117 [Chitinophaga polysaccharea]|uniref:PH (Pleckstrin Homology) domain-containing protein n=1 Tax=Chitinophaga polysaccharea TaxID=1293035 RepID=A0A561P418_9BACT|nr:hypothetical protein [Chitinophaga polysaccharea]TWF32862.1 hypothetical protein FHW36_113117 [Chitinophaga polysaccharea]